MTGDSTNPFLGNAWDIDTLAVAYANAGEELARIRKMHNQLEDALRQALPDFKGYKSSDGRVKVVFNTVPERTWVSVKIKEDEKND